jgi:hypothetical protein
MSFLAFGRLQVKDTFILLCLCYLLRIPADKNYCLKDIFVTYWKYVHENPFRDKN